MESYITVCAVTATLGALIVLISGARIVKRLAEIRAMKTETLVKLVKQTEQITHIDHRTTRNTQLIAILLEANLSQKLVDREQFIRTSILSNKDLCK
jgi:hypothetical protein